jgi:hypothetical protein
MMLGFNFVRLCLFGTIISLSSVAMPIRAFSQEATFGGNDCTEDCSGHAAGYRRAEENGVTVASDCGGNSQSFIEGCETYADDPSRGAEEDDQGNEIVE